MTAQGGHPDVIGVLTHDHREIEAMLDRWDTIPADRTALRRELVDKLIIEVVRHGVAEEEYLYPAVRRWVPGGDRIADKAIADQAAAERTMKELERIEAGDPHFGEVFARLAREVREHVADGEGVILPRLAAVCDEATLTDLGGRIERAERMAPTRPHPSAPDTPPLNRLSAPATGLVDRARDVVTRRGR
ncbi:hemerythrin domain-containing protein [Thermomonospora umbrina]|uniref:Hemerythrin HHE cation binding domain-containing protein n=1 Tax=Thermomonospora umbrina TaxID=111806 RepID=A0A3D9SGU9_9ACTN|nr:hemerythrin domain-containing protein [Thermomonospora umbrina]REE95129.1 hemerythrin HHE cation binding domain-containing protein [Thermomonospora umbrina]